MKTIALVVAGGSGQRYAGSIPKQYDLINGTSILAQTITKFSASKLIDAIQVVIRPEDIELYNKSTLGLNLLPVCFAGETRADSVVNGLSEIAKYNPEFVLIHDACRPYLSTNLIDNIADELLSGKFNAVSPALAINETVKRISNEKAELVNRDNLFLIQTPQGFNYKQLFSLTQQANHKFTDESSLCEANGLEVTYLPGEKENIKITSKEDKMLNTEVRIGSGFDAHRFSEDVSEHNYVILGGIKIPFTRKLEAYSDGDVLIHALVDALLGAISEGDIGLHFPPSDEKWKNADSKLFLIHANELLKRKNGRINNVDIAVICEQPKMTAYKEQIRMNLASVLAITNDRVNIKATTTEGMGFTGRGEGIAVQAVVSISLSS